MKGLELSKVYSPAEVEARWYPIWEEAGLFRSEVPTPAELQAGDAPKPYAVCIPPPNITGSLHMGHALNNTIQDILIRSHRMRGYRALWLPGTDHAGIATQAMVEKDLKKEGKTRHDLGRDAFLERVWTWRDQYGRTIVGQLKRLGASCDWSRERFTMDAQCSRAVRVAFASMYDKGYIYRGKRIVNWCTHCLTALSDLEVEHEDDPNGSIYHLRYDLEDGSGSVTIATTRPETILADVAVAVHPDDPRYQPLIGRNVILPLVGRPIRLIGDSYVEREFGTGALKVTPAHDANDFEIGQRHGLETLVAMTETGIMGDLHAPYQGLERFACRKQIVRDLDEAGHLVKIEPYTVAQAKCYRCHTVLEPYLSDQWFVRMAELGRPALEVVREGKIRFFPERFAGLYIQWMENLRDWCVSRQLWWGHRVPVWTCQGCGHQASHIEDPTACPSCGSASYTQETDVLDTWFSSALWPLSTLGWPDQTPELDYFYPTAVLSTARDILYLWVARMIMTGLEFKGDIPFGDVYVHATVMAKDGRRMSKSLGTGVDPLDLFDRFGTDATRFGLAWMTGQGQDVRFSEDRIEMSRNFANKIWNAFRLAQRFLPEEPTVGAPVPGAAWRLEDRWITSRLQQVIGRVDAALEAYAFDVVARELYEFFWDDVCDWYLELIKPAFYDRSDAAEQAKNAAILDYVFGTYLRLLHPVMPFISEEIWQQLPGERGYCMVAPWPVVEPGLVDEAALAQMDLVRDAIRGVRNLRAEMNAPAKADVPVTVVFADEASRSLLEASRGALKRLAQADPIEIVASLEVKPPTALSARVGGGELFVEMGGGADVGKEVERLEKEMVDLEGQLARVGQKLGNASFVERAKPEVVARERERAAELEASKAKVGERLAALKAAL